MQNNDIVWIANVSVCVYVFVLFCFVQPTWRVGPIAIWSQKHYVCVAGHDNGLGSTFNYLFFFQDQRSPWMLLGFFPPPPLHLQTPGMPSHPGSKEIQVGLCLRYKQDASYGLQSTNFLVHRPCEWDLIQVVIPKTRPKACNISIAIYGAIRENTVVQLIECSSHLSSLLTGCIGAAWSIFSNLPDASCPWIKTICQSLWAPGNF